MKNHIKQIHISIIVLTFVLLLLGVFNQNLWFDEAYSVGLANQNWGNLIISGAYDVHPILYYMFLKVFTMIFGNSMIAFRIFSVIPIVLLSIFSYTHIRKEFGEKLGAYFAFILLFLPVTFHYGTQIRMYSLSMLFLAITAFYAYKAYKENERQRKNWILFAVFSVLSAYTHYFGLVTIGMINLTLLYFIIRYKRELLKKWFIYGIIQFIAYLPGLLIFAFQSSKVAKGFWISVNYPNIFMEIVEFFFKDTINSPIPAIFGLVVFVYTLLRLHTLYMQDKEKIRPILAALWICGLVIGISLLVSLVRPIFIPRYMLPMSSLAIFALAYTLSNDERKWIKGVICIGLIALSIWNGYTYWNSAYSEENQKPFAEVRDQVQDQDIFIYTTIGPGSLMAMEFNENQQYFYNKDHWDVEVAYGAFKPQMECIETLKELEDYHGRIWVIDSAYTNLYDELKQTEGYSLTKETVSFYHPFSGDTFKISLFEKK